MIFYYQSFKDWKAAAHVRLLLVPSDEFITVEFKLPPEVFDPCYAITLKKSLRDETEIFGVYFNVFIDEERTEWAGSGLLCSTPEEYVAEVQRMLIDEAETFEQSKE